MRIALKWIGWGLLALVALVVFDDLDKTTGRWIVAGGAAGWFGYVVVEKLERIRADIAILNHSALSDLHNFRNGVDRCEELLENLRDKVG
jgi:hypothetical protein